MQRNGKLIYRCRRCQKEFESQELPDLGLGLYIGMILEEDLNTILKIESLCPPKILEIHQCEDGNIGIADCIGGIFLNGKEDR